MHGKLLKSNKLSPLKRKKMIVFSRRRVNQSFRTQSKMLSLLRNKMNGKKRHLKRIKRLHLKSKKRKVRLKSKNKRPKHLHLLYSRKRSTSTSREQ